MDGRIEQLRSHYRIFGARAKAPALAARLDRVFSGAGLKYYEEALQQALGNDEAVYVLRRVDAAMTLVADEGESDAELAKNWGTRLAKAVAQEIAEPRDPGNLVQFENHADYVAHFLVALLTGTQCDQWFYRAFAEFGAADRLGAVKRILLQHIDDLPAILAYVHRYHQLDSLIASLDKETRVALWASNSDQRDGEEVGRSLFIIALQFVDGLQAWSRMPRDGEDLFRQYLQTAPPPPDWKDRRALAVYVFEVVRFFFARGHLRRNPELTPEFEARIDKTLRDFEWLDIHWLRAALLDILGHDQPRPAFLPVRVSNGRATPRQLEMLTTLASVLRAAGSRAIPAEHEAAALKLLPLLVAEAPGWRDDAAAKFIIDSLLTARNSMQAAAAPAEFAARLRAGDVESAFRLLPAQTKRVSEACRFVARMGEPALALVEELCEQPPTASLVRGVETDYAGSALLLRSMLDARLHLLPDEILYPPAAQFDRTQVLFLLIALKLGGGSGIANGRIDEGLSLLTGFDHSADFDTCFNDWSELDQEQHLRFQKALLRIMAAQRLLQPAVMHVFHLEMQNGKRVAVAGDASGILWPLGRIVESSLEMPTTVSDMKAAWEEVTGIRPQVISDDPVSDLDQSWRKFSEEEEIRTTHEAGKEALRSAVIELDHGQTGSGELDLAIIIISCLLLRLWARWLPGFSTSSVPFLLENFVRRRGLIQAGSDALVVELTRGPMDMVIEMAGYLADVDRVPWLPGRRLKFLLRGM